MSSNQADLGIFKLGTVNLGAQLSQMSMFDSFSMSDSIDVYMEALLEDALTFADYVDVVITIEMFTDFQFFENIWYPAFYQAGIRGRIVNPIDVTSEGFCEAVINTGQSLELNDVPARAFIQVKQRIQTFDNEIKIFPGDAVMYSCPDLVIAVGDVVFHNFIEYTIFTWIDRLFNGNTIFRKVALRRKELFNIPMPQVAGLAASPNYEGKTTLTWDEVDKDVFPSFDHFNVYRSLVTGGPYTLVDSTKSNKFTDTNLIANTPYFYVVAAVDKYGFEGTPSAEVETGTDTTKPSKPIGGR